jgi:hypothetical protein
MDRGGDEAVELVELFGSLPADTVERIQQVSILSREEADVLKLGYVTSPQWLRRLIGHVIDDWHRMSVTERVAAMVMIARVIKSSAAED